MKFIPKFVIGLMLLMVGLVGCNSQSLQTVTNQSQGAPATQQNQSSNASSSSDQTQNQNLKAASNTTTASNQQVNTTNNDDLANLNFDGKNQVLMINNNHATFSKEDLSLNKGNWQTFSNLDQYNRVGVANAMLNKSMMPKAKRERLYVNPTGWKNKQITVNGKREWLYNRSHLIGFQFTGENNNIKNLMTGTRSFNDPGMLVYEDQVATYLRTTGNNVRYQVEPIFRGNELVARGVHMMAKSVEDNRLEFNVYIFNVEPGVVINYADGTSRMQ
jgi:DNA-entry nuclease